MKLRKDQIAIDRSEAQLAKRALQQLLDELEELKEHCATSSLISRMTTLQGKVRVGITALRDADGNDANARKTDVGGQP